ncbi:hypothetical protein WN48_06600 [Eufriesea mexicana]|uniref:Uncharacterized protein n=1 Tax=Eufriesea mexicana TaxID=516756 RepID=A0A310SBU3_9HYME|nr:hypothetical protein WN48_06600 [Eufriesea mexicana]
MYIGKLGKWYMRKRENGRSDEERKASLWIYLERGEGGTDWNLFGVSGVEGCRPEMVGTCNPPASLRSLDVR